MFHLGLVKELFRISIEYIKLMAANKNQKLITRPEIYKLPLIDKCMERNLKSPYLTQRETSKETGLSQKRFEFLA